MTAYEPTPEVVKAAARAEGERRYRDKAQVQAFAAGAQWHRARGGDFPREKERGMSDTREALPAAEDDAVEKAARAWHEAAEAMDDEGPQMGPWDDLDPHDRDRARRYMRAALDAAGVGALRAEVERLRAVSAAQPYETERELAVALDEARRQVADLRARIESVQKAIENNRGIDRAWDALNALLSGSGEQPGEVEGYCTCHDDQKGRTRDCGVKVHREAGRPAPVVPDSADVRSVVAARVAFEEAGVRLMAVAGADATRYLDALGRAVAAGATVGDIAALASPLAAQSVARAWDEYVRARIDAEARTGDRRRVAERVRRQERRRSFEAGFAAALAEKGAPRG